MRKETGTWVRVRHLAVVLLDQDKYDKTEPMFRRTIILINDSLYDLSFCLRYGYHFGKPEI